ncbi:hypothetical protein C5167_018268 [Papaver somniferum]|uniref:Uncharacterized protein n=1 Tax=Papaver somniferum TaxID=3469 RepID=A0A4Y7IQ70_PAPSO|nr:hypothetical protein C5167_018268 [Papaver somniferum]
MQSRFTCLGRIPTDTGRRLSYHWSSAKGLGSSLAELRSYSLDLLSRFTYPGTISTDLKMIVSLSSLIIKVRREHEQTSGIGYLVRLRVDLTWTRPIAFGASLFIVVGNKFVQASIPIVLFCCCPLALFAWLQLPLFVEMVRNTYWGSLFQKHRLVDFSGQKNNYKSKKKEKET